MGRCFALFTEIRGRIAILQETRHDSQPSSGKMLAREAFARERYSLRLQEECRVLQMLAATAEADLAVAWDDLGEAARARLQIERLHDRERTEAARRAERSEAHELDEANGCRPAMPGPG